MDYKMIFDEIQKNEVHITYRMAKEPLPLGTSKIGGKPHLPKNFEWFQYDGEHYDGEFGKRSLAFLMQINCERIGPFDKEHKLPKTGFLYFFYEISACSWSGNDFARVFYFDGTKDDLEVREFPEDLTEEYRFPECALLFTNQKNIPDFEEFGEFYPDCDFDDYEAAAEASGFVVDKNSDEITKLLGYADLLQGSAVWECEMDSRTLNTGDWHNKMTAEQQADIITASRDWVLLAQFGTLSAGDVEWMWGDCGCLYFYIREKDLAEKNFDRIWMIFQCC